MRQKLGRYIVVDSKICHGQPTFRGTRVMVKDILEQVARGMSWDSIVDEWRQSFGKPAIAEAIRLAGAALISQVGDQRIKPAS